VYTAANLYILSPELKLISYILLLDFPPVTTLHAATAICGQIRSAAKCKFSRKSIYRTGKCKHARKKECQHPCDTCSRL